MRMTGIAVALAGVVMALFAGVGAVVMRDNPAGATGDAGIVRAGSDLTVPATFAFAALLIGGLLYVFGNRGYIATQDPAVRN